MAKNITYIHSQTLSIVDGQLILPNTAVAEILYYSDPLPIDKSPAWLLGTIEWHGIRIPLISLEHAMGNDLPAYASNNHIAVLNCLSNNKQSSFHFYGIVTLGLPKLHNIDENKITPSTNKTTNPLVLSNVLVNKLESIIPDLDAVESKIKESNFKMPQVG